MGFLSPIFANKQPKNANEKGRGNLPRPHSMVVGLRGFAP